MESDPTAQATSHEVAYHDHEPFEIDAQGLHLRFVPAGPDRLDTLVDLIDGAQTRLRLCFYIFADDASGKRVRDALTRAAERGVDVHLVIDGFGAETTEEFFRSLTDAGGSFHEFSAKWSRRYLIRNHQKIVLVDDETAMIGGFNVEDAYFETPECDG